MKNEALRIFLAVAALILTAMITNTSGTPSEAESNQRNIAGQTSELNQAQIEQLSMKKDKAKVKSRGKNQKKGLAVKTVHRANRSFAFFFRR